MSSKNVPKPEYPRPQFVRENNWINLNGEWEFNFDDENIGLKEKWYDIERKKKFDKKITVPFCFQSKLSGINDQSFHDVVWYRKEFNQLKGFKGKRLLLHFEAVDYLCRIYLNGIFIGSHEGGYVGFSFDITDYISESNSLVVRVEDPSTDCEIPRGKQFWEEKYSNIFYPRVTGIWETVWLEAVNLNNYIEKVKITSNVDKAEIIIHFNIFGKGFKELNLKVVSTYQEKIIFEDNINLENLGELKKSIKGKSTIKEKMDFYEKTWRYVKNPNQFRIKFEIKKEHLRLWNVDDPNLYELELILYNAESNEIYDKVKSYFGMRKISILNNKIMLNNKPIYQKLVLVQGYWENSLYTAPSDEAIIKDIQFIKEFGFNGLRTHQKTFSRRYVYWCDKLGLLIWGEMGNAFMFSKESQVRFFNQYVEMITRDYNHPSIVAWVLLNEGWGVNRAEQDKRMVNYSVSLYYFIKSIDPTRLIIDDDGWWHTKTDICTKHFYLDLKLLPKNYEEEINFKEYEPFIPKFYLDPFEYSGEPIIYSEIGGFGFDYFQNLKNTFCQAKVRSSDELFEKIVNLLKAFDKRKDWIQGFCYTELYDQFQEINGLLTIDRVPKFLPEKLKKEISKLFY